MGKSRTTDFISVVLLQGCHGATVTATQVLIAEVFIDILNNTIPHTDRCTLNYIITFPKLS